VNVFSDVRIERQLEATEYGSLPLGEGGSAANEIQFEAGFGSVPLPVNFWLM
jgi:hypothetical protein